MGIDLKVKIGKIELENPVMVASGTFGYGREFEGLVDVDKLGAIVTKTITLNPRHGNPPPRIIETPSGMLNAIGIQNDGVDDFINYKVSYLKKIKVPIIASIAGERISEYAEVAKKLDGVDKVAGIELNVSCPNMEWEVSGGKCRIFAQDAEAIKKIVSSVKAVTKKTIIAKLSPNVTDISEMAGAAVEGGSDAISLVNTFLGMAVDTKTKKPKIANVTGGLSGPCIKPLALRMVWEVYKAVKVPIIGMGGIANGDDAIEFMLCGASAVAVGTTNFVDPQSSMYIIEGISRYMSDNTIKSVKEIVGGLKV